MFFDADTSDEKSVEITDVRENIKHLLDADVSDEKSVEIADFRENTKYEPQPPSALTADFKSTVKKDEVKNQYAFLTPELTSSVIQDGKKIFCEHTHPYNNVLQ